MRRTATIIGLACLLAVGACQRKPPDPPSAAPAGDASTGPPADYSISMACKDGTTVYRLTNGGKLAVWEKDHFEAFESTLTASAYCASHKK